MDRPVATRAAAEKPREDAVDSGRGGDEPWKTVLFNCDCHTFDEVEKIVIKATRCTLSRARAVSNEIHVRGSASIYEGPRERCEAVADVVASIGLKVKVVR